MTVGRVAVDLTLDCDDLAGLNVCDVREAGGYEGQQVFETVGLRVENDDGQVSGQLDFADTRSLDPR
jgi:hypothetical protein